MRCGAGKSRKSSPAKKKVTPFREGLEVFGPKRSSDDTSNACKICINFVMVAIGLSSLVYACINFSRLTSAHQGVPKELIEDIVYVEQGLLVLVIVYGVGSLCLLLGIMLNLSMIMYPFIAGSTLVITLCSLVFAYTILYEKQIACPYYVFVHDKFSTAGLSAVIEFFKLVFVLANLSQFDPQPEMRFGRKRNRLGSTLSTRDMSVSG